MNFYHNLVTEKSWKLLCELKSGFDFILIGGWAVFLYTKALKSKDIDLVIDFEGLEKFKEQFEVVKNDRLKKYEARSQEVEIDIYVPFYSSPGLPAEDLKDYEVSLEGFKVVEKEALAILKQKALMERADSVKGRKDLIDLVSLFRLSGFNFRKYQNLIKKYDLRGYLPFVANIILKTRAIDELDLNIHQMSRLKKQILSNLTSKTGN